MTDTRKAGFFLLGESLLLCYTGSTTRRERDEHTDYEKDDRETTGILV